MASSLRAGNAIGDPPRITGGCLTMTATDRQRGGEAAEYRGGADEHRPLRRDPVRRRRCGDDCRKGPDDGPGDRPRDPGAERTSAHPRHGERTHGGAAKRPNEPSRLRRVARVKEARIGEKGSPYAALLATAMQVVDVVANDREAYPFRSRDSHCREHDPRRRRRQLCLRRDDRRPGYRAVSRGHAAPGRVSRGRRLGDGIAAAGDRRDCDSSNQSPTREGRAGRRCHEGTRWWAGGPYPIPASTMRSPPRERHT